MSGTKEVFDELLMRLEPEFPNSKARYDRFRFKMLRFFEWKSCKGAEEELADETITRIVSQLISGKQILAENPYSYVYGVARNVFREYVRNQIKIETLVNDLLHRFDEPEDFEDCRLQCLQELSSEKLELLQRYYLNPQDRQAQAQQLNLTMNALRLQVHRHKGALRTCHERCRRKLFLT
jgi:DNA-directed RNA polymerase specialized sigma24 family protein